MCKLTLSSIFDIDPCATHPYSACQYILKNVIDIACIPNIAHPYSPLPDLDGEGVIIWLFGCRGSPHDAGKDQLFVEAQ